MTNVVKHGATLQPVPVNPFFAGTAVKIGPIQVSTVNPNHIVSIFDPQRRMWFDMRGNLHPTGREVAIYVETPATMQWHQIKYDVEGPGNSTLENNFKLLQAKYDDMLINYDQKVTDLQKLLNKTARERDALRQELALRFGEEEAKPPVSGEADGSKGLKAET